MKTLQMLRIQGILAACFMAVNLNAQYQMNFEFQTKGSYDSDTIECNSITWNLTDVLIGTTEYDWKNGNASARLRGYGTSCMSMVTDKTDGFGTLSFQYNRYGTDTQVAWKVEYSTDGGTNWTQLGSDFTALTDGTVSTFSQKVNINSNIRVRIKKSAEDGTTNKRLNIDDIVMTNYNESVSDNFELKEEQNIIIFKEGRNLKITSNESGRIEIFNLNGQNIFKEKILKNNALNLNLEYRSTEFYIIQFISDSGKTTRKKILNN